MTLRRTIVVGIMLAAVLGISGCKRKKPPLPPPQANAPTITQPQPEAAPPPEETKPQPEVTQPAAPPQPAAEKPAPKPRPKHRPRVFAKKEPPRQPPPKPGEKPRVVVPETGGQPASSGQLSASIPGDTATHQKLNTAQLLEATDYNLKSITRTLTADEQAMVQHIRSYMTQSRQATQDGDTERAYNLALKAHLLSDEIVKR